MKDDTTDMEKEPDPKDASEESESSPGVKVPEEFQTAVHDLLSSCDSQECLDYLQSCVSRASSDMYDKKQKSSKTKDYSTADEPKD